MSCLEMALHFQGRLGILELDIAFPHLCFASLEQLTDVDAQNTEKNMNPLTAVKRNLVK